MRAIAVACVKNEVDIVEAFVRHTLAYVDRMVVLDNGSQDGTCDVLRAMEKEGLSLDVVEDPSIGKYQAQRMTRLMREWAVGRYDADWVLALDGDEFLAIPQGSPLIPDELNGDRPIPIPWRTYVPDEEDDASQPNPVLRIRRRRAADQWELAKVMVPRSLAALPQANLAQGNHEILVDGQRCEPCSRGSGYLAHFPIRSPGQYAAKIAINSLQYQAMANRRSAESYHYREPFDLLKRDLAAFTASLSQTALRYSVPREAKIEPRTVFDPLPYRGGPLRYTPRVADTSAAWYALLSYAEDLARQYAVLAAGLTDDQQLALQQLATVVAGLHDQLEQQRRDLAHAIANLATEREETRRQLAQARQSWTWQIGRLWVGPVARANRLRQRCSQVLAGLCRRVKRERPPLPNLEIHVAHSCNLHCESCSHYANQGHRGIVSIEEADRWMKLWNQKLNPQVFSLVGGEPAMHPQLTRFVRLSRKNWPNAELRLITNGLLLQRHPDLPTVLRDTNTSLCLSIHHRSPQYKEQLQPILELVETWVASHGIRLQYLQSHRSWTRRYKGFGSAMEPFDDRQPRLSWENCVAKNCRQLFEGRIWKCAPLAYLKLQAAKYSLSEPWRPYLRYQPLQPDCTPDELAAFLAQEDESCCNMCASRPQPFELPCPLTAPASRQARRLAG
jgi:hypothetical protein